MRRKLVVGLGNPGERYARTRHNVGFDIVDLLVEQCGSSVVERSLRGGQLWHGERGDDELVLLKPLEYMNRSGGAVLRVVVEFGVVPEDVLVVYDDLDLDPGRLRLRPSGSAGGHRGLQDIVQRFHPNVQRLRVGIGRAPAEVPVEEYVLERFDAPQHELIERARERAVEAVLCWFDAGIVAAANKYNAAVPPVTGSGDDGQEEKGQDGQDSRNKGPTEDNGPENSDDCRRSETE